MITDFKLFEYQLRDLTSPNSYVESPQKFFDEKLITKVFIPTGGGYVEELRFAYNDRPDHSIYNKIEERTHLKSISEFNSIFEKTIKQIIPSKFKDIDKKGCYVLNLLENKFYIIIEIDPNALIEGYFIKYGRKIPYHSYVITIHNYSTLQDYRYYKMIDIDDSYFNV